VSRRSRPQFLVDDLDRSSRNYPEAGFQFRRAVGAIYAIGRLDGLEIAPEGKRQRIRPSASPSSENEHSYAFSRAFEAWRTFYEPVRRQWATRSSSRWKDTWGTKDFYIEDPDGYSSRSAARRRQQIFVGPERG